MNRLLLMTLAAGSVSMEHIGISSTWSALWCLPALSMMPFMIVWIVGFLFPKGAFKKTNFIWLLKTFAFVFFSRVAIIVISSRLLFRMVISFVIFSFQSFSASVFVRSLKWKPLVHILPAFVGHDCHLFFYILFAHLGVVCGDSLVYLGSFDFGVVDVHINADIMFILDVFPQTFLFRTYAFVLFLRFTQALTAISCHAFPILTMDLYWFPKRSPIGLPVPIERIIRRLFLQTIFVVVWLHLREAVSFLSKDCLVKPFVLFINLVGFKSCLIVHSSHIQKRIDFLFELYSFFIRRDVPTVCAMASQFDIAFLGGEHLLVEILATKIARTWSAFNEELLHQ